MRLLPLEFSHGHSNQMLWDELMTQRTCILSAFAVSPTALSVKAARYRDGLHYLRSKNKWLHQLIEQLTVVIMQSLRSPYVAIHIPSPSYCPARETSLSGSGCCRPPGYCFLVYKCLTTTCYTYELSLRFLENSRSAGCALTISTI
jgi:hypothetical protein